jgi:hypothetical protein
MFWLGLGIGLVVGGAAGMFAMALCSIGKKGD